MLTTLFQAILKWLSRRKPKEYSEQSPSLSDSLQDSQDKENLTKLPSDPNKISPNFSLKEATKSATADARGIKNTPSPSELEAIKDTAMRMEQVRYLLGNKPILINSWFRNAEVNKAVGGSSTSDHMSGRSVDFTCPQYGSVLSVCKAIRDSGIKFDQLIYETNSRGSQWVHLGFGERMRGQVLTKKPSTGYLNGLVE